MGKLGEPESRTRARAARAVERPLAAELRATRVARRALLESGLLQRVLLTTDGSVGPILQAYAGESIEAVKLEQFALEPDGEHRALKLADGDERLWRRVILRGARTGRSLMYAECLIALARLHPAVRAGLLETSEPIGRLLSSVRAETFREILSSGRTAAGPVGASFGIHEEHELFVRTYRIIESGRPIMLITEKFPTTWFLD